MSRFRDKAATLQMAAALLGLLVAFQLGVNADQAPLWLAALNAVFGLLAALVVRPFAPAVLTTLITTGAALAAGYGFDLPPDKLSAVNLAVVALATFIVMRPNTSPKEDPQPGQGVPQAVATKVRNNPGLL